MSSFWKDNLEIKKYPSLTKNLNTDVCIIGGGITGISCGYYLAKNNLKVCILEKDTIMNKTSGHTTAKITAQHGLIYKYLVDSYSEDFAKKYLKSNLEAIENIKKIVDDEKINCDYEIQNSYVYTTVPSSISKIEDEFKILRKLNYKTNLLDSIDLPISNVEKAIQFENQAQFNPVKYAISLCQKIEENNGVIFEKSKVMKIKKVNNEYVIFCNGNCVKAKYIVIATRYPIINFPGFYFLKMYSETSNIIAIETEKDLFNGMYISENQPIFSFRTSIYNEKKIVLIGGTSHKTGAKIDLSNSYKILEQKANEMYPDNKILFRWNTQDSVSLDKIPYIGEFSSFYPNAYIATGFKKWGMTTSNVAANIIADEILGKKNKYSEIYNSKRLRPIKNRKELGNMIKETTYSLVLNKFDLPKAEIEDINLEEGKIVNYNDHRVGVYKDKNNNIFKVIPNCTHLGCELSWNNLDKTWDCPCHGSKYNFDGKLIYGPSCKDLKVIDKK